MKTLAFSLAALAAAASTGAYRFGDLPAEMQLVQVRHLGFEVQRDALRRG